MSKQSFNLDLPHHFLEMARSVFTHIYAPKDKKEVKIDSKNEQHYAGIIFSMTTATVIYSYMAIESFINYRLYKLWEDSRDVHATVERAVERNPALQIVPRLDDFYNSYGKENEFEKLSRTDLSDLKTRVKVVIDGLEIRQIHSTNPQLWSDFNQLLTQARHFLIHPFPDPTKFQEIMKKLLMETPAGKYAETAASIIKHFYEEKKDTPPDWIEKNTVFKIAGFESLV